MSWRNVVVTKPARLRVKNEQLVLSSEEEELSIPIEDLATVILESQQINLSAALLDSLNQKGVCLIVCDKKHMPNGMMLSHRKHHRQSEVAHLQVNTKKPLLKRCWKKVVQQKIKNQADCLKFYNTESKAVSRLVQKVASGDPANIEAQAARNYWTLLFEGAFKRGSNTVPDIMLDYGYTILRGIVARAIVGSGLATFLGIHHCNKLNPYNLVDDLMEPFRPEVDRIVIKLWQSKPEEFTKLQRYELANVGSTQVYIKDQAHSLIRASEIMSASFVASLRKIKMRNYYFYLR